MSEEIVEAELSMRPTVVSGQGTRVTESLPVDGKLTQIMFHFPLGCNGLVEVILFKDGKPFYPIHGTMALDNATPIFYGNADYMANEPLTLEVQNKDTLNPHTISCTIVIRYKKRWWSN